MGYAPATFLARHLDAAKTLPGSCRLHVEQEYASGVCVGDEILLGFPRRLSKKNGYALGMRQPHSSLVIWIQPISRQIPFGARVCVRGMRWGRDPIGLPKPSLEK